MDNGRSPLRHCILHVSGMKAKTGMKAHNYVQAAEQGGLHEQSNKSGMPIAGTISAQWEMVIKRT